MGISIPIAVLIWVMIYPMMMSVDFKQIQAIGREPKGLFVTWAPTGSSSPYDVCHFLLLFIRRLWRLDTG